MEAKSSKPNADDMAILTRMAEKGVSAPCRGREAGYALRLLRASYIRREHISMREYVYHVTEAGRAAVKAAFYGEAAAVRAGSAHHATIESAIHCATRAASFAHKS